MKQNVNLVIDNESTALKISSSIYFLNISNKALWFFIAGKSLVK